MPLEINALESDRFGIIAARLSDGSTDLSRVNQKAKTLGVDMSSLRVDAARLDYVHKLEADGYRLMDTLVYYARSLPAPETARPLPQGVQLHIATPEDAAAVAHVARAAFKGYLGHYHMDPRLDDTAADAVYVEWAETSIRSTGGGTPAFVARQGGDIVGFLTLRANTSKELEIVLNAVHPDYQRTGIYDCLLSHAIHPGAKPGARRIIVSTQINNYPVQRAWARQGFTHFRSLYTFHKWYT